MKKIYFIINKCSNHRDIKLEGSGACELLFYMTAYKLSNYYDVTIFNRGPPTIIDNVKYLSLPDNKNPNIENINNSTIVVQRHFSIALDLHKINPTNKYFLWSHDYIETDCNNNNNLCDQYSTNYVADYFCKNNLSIIAVSNFHKNNIINKIPNVNVNVIYNALFPELYPNINLITPNVNKNQIVFASSWSKGLDKILNIGKEYYKRNNEFKLILLKPSYCEWIPDFSQYPFINCLGNIKDKTEYCKIIKSSLCVFTTSYQETFGCVFAESLHFGVPVIGDNSIQAGFHEIIESKYMCNFDNVEEVITKIEHLKNNNNNNICLKNKFYDKQIINEWIKILN